MIRTRVLTGIVATAFCFAFALSARADSVNDHGEMMMLEKLIFAERHGLIVFTDNATNYLYTGHFEGNNGKHLGFSVAAFTKGPQLGVVNQNQFAPGLVMQPQTTPANTIQVSSGTVIQGPATAAVTQNPEPAALVLLGTGLAGAGAFARKRHKKN